MEAGGLLSGVEENCYPISHTLLEACRMVGDSDGASQVQAVVERLGLIAFAPAVLVPVLQQRYKDGVSGGERVTDGRML